MSEKNMNKYLLIFTVLISLGTSAPAPSTDQIYDIVQDNLKHANVLEQVENNTTRSVNISAEYNQTNNLNEKDKNIVNSVVSSLLGQLLQDTLYRRMEQLFLGPDGSKHSSSFERREKNKILETAVKNYKLQQQQIKSNYRRESRKQNLEKAMRLTTLAGQFISKSIYLYIYI